MEWVQEFTTEGLADGRTLRVPLPPLPPNAPDPFTTGFLSSNTPEARLLHDHHFPSGECRKRITTSLGIATEPDWLHEPTKVAVYLDGMSRGLHGDPNVARKDQIIRQAVVIP